MMILKNKLCGSASSARQGLSDPTLTGSFERFLIIIHAFALHDEKALTAKNRRLFSPNIR